MTQLNEPCLPAMAREPGKILADLLKDNGIRKSDLAEWMDVKWQTMLRWTKGQHFNEDNQREVLIKLRELVKQGKISIAEDLSHDNFFSKEIEELHRALRAHRESAIRVFEAQSKIGRSLSPESRARLLQLPLEYMLDTPACEALILVERGLIPAEKVQEAAEAQRELLRSANSKKTTSPKG